MLYLDRNENLYGPAPKCFEVLRSVTLEELSIYSRDFTRGVKSRLSERLANELGIPEPQILLSEGSEDMLKQAVHCYLGPGEKILCPDQSWWYYRAVASEVGGETVTYRLKRLSDRYSYDVGEMITLYEKISPRVVLIASPNNPTGNSFRDDDLQTLTEAFRESIVILDEAYWGFEEQANNRIAGLIGRYRNLLILRTFSKFYALAGARVGYAAAGASLSRLTRFASRYLGYNRISEELALAALDSPEYYDTIGRTMQSDRERFYEFFGRLSGTTCFRSQANFVLVRVPAEAVSPLRKFLSENGIAVKFFKEEEFKDCLRITLGTRDQNELVLTALDSFFRFEGGTSS
ncbi:MAG: aminotransferase class I/II-fold pyridoxal phosphate-dependent enzyme [Ignavibacteriales bacterium]|nr:aminotransferase class I/II-fold pyridoxal phosphate-dependent enzyme [Ignavibacteriales bacterium]